ncbi:MAG TPA: hypothetical protein QF469_11945 [Sphingomonas sanguinis]|uniref:hypothetical protein n=1 Tax=Sphingomonas sanguinis TaxID=33051 RepID=UPI002ABFF266|nr:hypothetical protein [Sphingomonas sanguinis]
MNIQAKPTKHSAPGQYLGFALQPVRAFYHLLTVARGAKVSLELLDDVAIHYADNTLCLEQTKSALKQNPISDWANDLWKAIDNWLTMLKAGECEAGKTSFRLYVVPQKKGEFARALSSAGTPGDVATVIATIRRKLAKLKEAPACMSKLQPLLDATEEQQTAIIANFELESEAPEPLEAIRARLRPMVPESVIDLLCRSGIGQAKQAFDRLIERGETPILDADTFKQAYGAFLRQNLMSGFLPALSEAPAEELVIDIMSTRPIFIRQLELIEASSDDQRRTPCGRDTSIRTWRRCCQAATSSSSPARSARGSAGLASSGAAASAGYSGHSGSSRRSFGFGIAAESAVERGGSVQLVASDD